MKKIIRLIPVLLFAALSTSVVQAQEWKPVQKEAVLQALKTSNQNMLKAKTLEVEMIQTIFDLDNHNVLASGNGFFKRKDSVFLHTRMLGVETIQNREYRLLVDSSNKTILLNRPVAMTPALDLANIETFFNLYPIKNMRSKDMKEKGILYFIEFETSGGYPVESLGFTVSAEGLITEFEMVMNQGIGGGGENKSRITIQYFNYRLNHTMDSDDFDLNNYLTFNQGVAKPAKAFSAYEFVNTSGK